jgi:hypothetical protein
MTAWYPQVNGPVGALVVDDHRVYAGGDFTMAGGWRHRAGLAALDLSTGMVKPWNPNPDGATVSALAVVGDRVYVGGDFAHIGGQARNNIASLDTLNGEATDWNPGANEYVSSLVAVGDTVFAGGYFTWMGGQRRRYIAALNATTGTALAWNPDADWPVKKIAVSGGTIYAGGGFSRIGGQPRMCLAALDPTTGLATGWDPHCNDWVFDIVVKDSTLYVGGYFGSIGGQNRITIAALDARTALATDWDPSPTPGDLMSPKVRALALSGNTVYAGGDFGSIGGKPRRYFGAVDATSGAATDWDPGVDGYVWSLLAGPGTVYAGGWFTRLGGLPCSCLAGFSVADEDAVRSPRDPVLTLAPIVPNPLRGDGRIRFTLAVPSAVDLSVYDVQGRRVASILHGQLLPSVEHDVPIRAADLPAGVYLCRLDAGGAVAVGKMLVLR